MLSDTYAWQKSLITVERPSAAETAKEAASYPNNDSDGDSQRRAVRKEGKEERSDGKKEAMALVFTLPNLPPLAQTETDRH